MQWHQFDLVLSILAVAGFAGAAALVWALFGRIAMLVLSFIVIGWTALAMIGRQRLTDAVRTLEEFEWLIVAVIIVLVIGGLTYLLAGWDLFRILRFSRDMRSAASAAGEVAQDVPSLGASAASPATEIRMKAEATETARWLFGEVKRLDEKADGTTRLFEEAIKHSMFIHGVGDRATVHQRELFLSSAVLSNVMFANSLEQPQKDTEILSAGLQDLKENGKEGEELRASAEFLNNLETALASAARRSPRALLMVKGRLAASEASLQAQLRSGLLHFYQNRNVHGYS